ncbi:hypothetical protein [Streptomyces armeniacus]
MGPGPQLIFNTPVPFPPSGQRDRRRAVAREHVGRLRQLFIEPHGFRQAHSTLSRMGAVLLTGPPGSGRRTAAMMLLSKLFHDSDDFHEITLDEGDPSLDPDLIGDNDRLLLDLSLCEESRYPKAQAKVAAFLPLLRARGSVLVVVLPHHLEQRPHDDFSLYTVEIERPRGAALLWRCLRLAEIYPAPEELREPKLAEFLDSSPGMETITSFADLVVRARRRSRQHEGFPAWRDEAIRALLNRSRNAAADIVLHDGQRRALCLSTAMLHEAPPDEIFSANEELLCVLRQPVDERPRLDHTDLTRRFSDIKAQPDGYGRVQFDLLAYDAAVRTHFWTYYPDLRPQFRTWVGRCVQRPTLGRQARSSLIYRFAEQCLRVDRPDDLTGLVCQWTAAGKSDHLLEAGYLALMHGLEHERYGARFRHELWEWSREPNLSESLARVLTSVCSEVVATRHPDQALVRLHHLSRHRCNSAADNARNALLQLVRPDNRLWRRLLHRLCRDLPRIAQERDAAVFLELATPSRLTDSGSRTRPLITNAEIRTQLLTCWTAVVHQQPRTFWEPYAQRWLTAASEDILNRERLLDILVDACAHESRALSQLYVVARDWAARSQSDSRASHTEVSSRLSTKLRAVLGVKLPSPHPRDPQETAP